MVIDNEYKKESEKGAGGGGLSKGNDNSGNQTEEEKKDQYKQKHALPEPDKKKPFDKPYVDAVNKSKDIN